MKMFIDYGNTGLVLTNMLGYIKDKNRSAGFIIAIIFSLLILSTPQMGLARSVIKTIKIVGGPHEIAFNPKNGDMFVGKERGGVSVIEPANDSVIKNLTVGASSMGFSSKSGNMYATATGSILVSVVDSKNNSLLKQIPAVVDNSRNLVGVPVAIESGGVNGNVYLPLVVYHIDPNSGIPDGNCIRNSTINCVVMVIDGLNNTVVNNIPVGRIVLDPNTRIATGVIAHNPRNGDIYVGNQRDKAVSVIDTATNKVVKNITLDGSPSAIGYNPNNGDIYVAGGSSNLVSVIDGATNQIVKNITDVGKGPNSISYNPKNGDIYVAGGSSNSIYRISSSNFSAKIIPVGNYPNAIAFDPRGDAYVTLGFANAVALVNGSDNKVKEIPVQEGPLKIAYNPTNAEMYVTSPLNDSVSVIGTNPVK